PENDWAAAAEVIRLATTAREQVLSMRSPELSVVRTYAFWIGKVSRLTPAPGVRPGCPRLAYWTGAGDLLARPANTVMLSLPPRWSARSSRVRQSCSEDSIDLMCSPISWSETCLVRPSLHSRMTELPRGSNCNRVTSGAASSAPMALVST